MAYAVSLLFDPEIADAVSERWRCLADAGLSRSMLDLGYPPHVTLAVYDRPIGEAAVTALDGVFRNVDRMAVSLTAIETFGSGSGVCYAALAPSPDLMRLHAMTVAAIGEGCRPHYQPGGWTPHCTLAVDLTNADMDRARDILQKGWRPRTGMFESATLVEFVPVVVIKRWPLGSTPRSSRTP
jgi:2'-5' RNA ligase